MTIKTNGIVIIGKELSRSNLRNMRSFYLIYENFQTLSRKLNWSHFNKIIAQHKGNSLIVRVAIEDNIKIMKSS